MEIIKEDYVSFETAKLLKDKGFDEPCFAYYSEYWDNWKSFRLWRKFPTRSVPNKGYLNVPTLQMARKWLRLKHGIYIDVHLSFTEDLEAYPAVYYVYILDARSGNSLLEKAAHIGELNPLMDVNNHNVPINFDSPEEAANVAIKYCLENLI